jgi:hypothetical protein
VTPVPSTANVLRKLGPRMTASPSVVTLPTRYRGLYTGTAVPKFSSDSRARIWSPGR